MLCFFSFFDFSSRKDVKLKLKKLKNTNFNPIKVPCCLFQKKKGSHYDYKKLIQLSE